MEDSSRYEDEYYKSSESINIQIGGKHRLQGGEEWNEQGRQLSCVI